MPPLVHKNEKGEICITMTEARYKAQKAMCKGFIWDSTPFSGEKTLKGQFPKLTLNQFYTDESQNLTAEVENDLPPDMWLIYQSAMVIPDKFYILQNVDDLLVVMFGEKWKVSFSTKVPKDDQLENPGDYEQQKLCMDYNIYAMKSQGFQQLYELQSALAYMLDAIARRLAESKKA